MAVVQRLGPVLQVFATSTIGEGPLELQIDASPPTG